MAHGSSGTISVHVQASEEMRVIISTRKIQCDIVLGSSPPLRAGYCSPKPVPSAWLG